MNKGGDGRQSLFPSASILSSSQEQFSSLQSAHGEDKNDQVSNSWITAGKSFSPADAIILTNTESFAYGSKSDHVKYKVKNAKRNKDKISSKHSHNKRLTNELQRDHENWYIDKRPDLESSLYGHSYQPGVPVYEIYFDAEKISSHRIAVEGHKLPSGVHRKIEKNDQKLEKRKRYFGNIGLQQNDVTKKRWRLSTKIGESRKRQRESENQHRSLVSLFLPVPPDVPEPSTQTNQSTVEVYSENIFKSDTEVTYSIQVTRFKYIF